MKTAIVIPARFGSSRLPGKPLLSKTGKPLIQHTVEQARKVKCASDIIVATDDRRIADSVADFGTRAVMTRTDHESGSARVAEVAGKIDADLIINLQGDEPEISPDHIDFLASIFSHTNSFAATLACPFPATARAGAGSPLDPAAVKVILGKPLTNACYEGRMFTRRLQPYPLDEDGAVASPSDFHMHLGIYAYGPAALKKFVEWPVGALERSENLEQLRILENSEKISVGIVDVATPGIDTPEDYAAFVDRQK